MSIKKETTSKRVKLIMPINSLVIVFFMVKGMAGYVLPRFENTVYI